MEKSAEFVSAVGADSHAFAREVPNVQTAKELHDLARSVVYEGVLKASLLAEDAYEAKFLPILLNAALRRRGAGDDRSRPRKRRLDEVIEEDPRKWEPAGPI